MRKIFCIVLLALLFFGTSCVENTGRGNLRIQLETGSQTKTLLPDAKSATIVKYNVKGTGPGGKSFSKDSSSKTVTIDGIPLGTWTVDAYGYNSDSVCIISGSKTFKFSNTTKSEQITMNSYAGTGALQVKLSWDKAITSPKVVIKISGTETITPDKNTTEYTYINNDLEAGSYLMEIGLYNGETFIIGTVEAVQIVNNKTTGGDVTLKTPVKGSSNAETLSVNPNTGHSVTGHFSVQGYSSLPVTLEAGKDQTIGLVLDSSLSDSDRYSLVWYLDGKPFTPNQTLKSVNTISVNPSVGNHIVDVVVSADNSVWSAHYPFTAESKAKKGAAVFVKELKANNTNKIILASDSMISSLPDNHYIIVTPSRSSMQVINVVKGNVILCADQTYNAVDLRFTWLSQVTGVYSDLKMNFFVLRVGTDEIHVLFFNPKTETIDTALWKEEPLIFSGFNYLPPAYIDEVSDVAFSAGNEGAGSIFIMDSGSRSEEILGIETTSSEIKSLGTSSKGKRHNFISCADSVDGLLGFVENDKLYFSKVKGCTTSSGWYTLEDDVLHDITDFKFLNTRFAIFKTESSLRIYEYYAQQKVWIARMIINSSTVSCDVSYDGAYIYIADSNANLTTYRSGLTDSFGKIFTRELPYSLTDITANTNTLIGKNTNGSLYIFEIAQEDSSL